jgi:helix-turn-helix protein
MPNRSDLSLCARRLGAALEPVVGQVYFSPECHANYVALGFDPSPGVARGVALPDGPAYFTSRGSVMGQVAGDVIAAAFAVFNPAVVVPFVEIGWRHTDAPTICQARTDGAVAQLRRILGDNPTGISRAVELLRRATEPLRPEGRPLYAGIRSLGIPDEPLATLWRLGDQLREYRGDSHTMAWCVAGFDATEIGLLTELYWGLPMRTYARTRAWSDADFDAAIERLRSRGLIEGEGFTATGRDSREAIEVATDEQMRPALDALGDDVVELCSILEPWGVAIRAGGGYLANGPHDLGGRG